MNLSVRACVHIMIGLSVIGPLLLSCGDDDSGFFSDCDSFTEIKLAESDCIAESLTELCEGLSCSSGSEIYIPSLFTDCAALDCTVLECGDTILTDIEIDPETDQTSAVVFIDGEDLGMRECSFVQP